MKVALLGVGRWGTNIKHTLESIAGVTVLGFNEATSPTPDYLHQHGVRAVLVATPGATHAEVALPFIRVGFPVFIEKPMTTSLRDAKKLVYAARRSGSRIFVGHIHVYNPAFEKAKALISKAGKIRSVSFEGMNWGPFREDMSALWDWAPHDVSMTLALFGTPTAVQAWGGYYEAVVRLELDSISVSIWVSTLSPAKRKRLTAVGTKYAIVLDDTKPKQKVMRWKQTGAIYPKYAQISPLTAELKAFLRMVKTNKAPKTDVLHGLEVVRILDAAQRSMTQNGRLINL